MSTVSIPDQAAAFRFTRGRTGCLMIHGLTGTPLVFRTMAARLADRGISVDAPLLPGHGTSPEDLIGVPWQSWVESARTAWTDLRSACDRVILVGHSVGGAIALYLAPEIGADGVVAISSPAAFRTGWAFALPVLRRFKRYWEKKRKPAAPEFGYDRYPLYALAEMIKLLSRMRKRLPRVSCPALIMHAKNDPVVSSRNSVRIYRRIASKDKRIRLLDDPTHLIPLGLDAEAVYHEIERFCLEDKGVCVP